MQNMRRWVGAELPAHMPDAWLEPLLLGVRDDLQAHWPRVEALAEELRRRWWVWGKRATAVIEVANDSSVAAAVIGRPISLPNKGDIASNGRVPPREAFSVLRDRRVSADKSSRGRLRRRQG